MTKLSKAIEVGDTEKALRLIRYPHLESLIYTLSCSFLNFILFPTIYLLSFVVGDRLEKLPKITYLDHGHKTADGKYHSPIYLAVSSGNIPVLDALCAQGVDINRRDPRDIALIEEALLSKNSSNDVEAIVNWLVEHGAEIPQDILFRVVVHPKLFVLFDFFVQRGADVHAKQYRVAEFSYAPGQDLIQSLSDVNPLTLLLKSICCNYDKDHQIIAKLIKAGANPNDALSLGWCPKLAETALSIALRKQRFKMAVELMRGGAEVDAMGKDDRTLVAILSPSEVQLALHLAAVNNINLTPVQLGQYKEKYNKMCADMWPLAKVIDSGRDSSLQASLFQFGLHANRTSNNPEQVVNQENSQAAIPEAVAVDNSTEIVVPPFTNDELKALSRLRQEMTYAM